MAEIDLSLISDTLDRVRESLNQRFEKDASLYISNQNVQKIKDLLRSYQYQGIYGMYQTNRLSAEILTKVILKNSWLIGKVNNRQIRDYIFPILKDCKPELFLTAMKEVMENKIEVPNNLKDMLLPLYFSKVNIEVCQEILDSDNDARQNNSWILEICFQRVIKNFESAAVFYRKVSNYFRKFYTLRNDKNILDINFLEEKQKLHLAKIIFNDEILAKEEISSAWETVFCGMGKISFMLVYLELKKCEFMDPRIKKLILYIPKVVEADKENQAYYLKGINELYNSNRCLRAGLIVWGCNRIREPELKKKMIASFKKIEIPESVRHIVEEIENGISNQVEINSADKLYKNIIEKNNTKAYRYIIAMLMKNEEANAELIFEELIVNHGGNVSIQEFTIELLRTQSKRGFWQMWQICFDYLEHINNADLKKQIIKLIRELKIKGEIIRKFLSENDFELCKEIFGRI